MKMNFVSLITVFSFLALKAAIIYANDETEVWLTVSSTLTYVFGKWRERLITLNWRNVEPKKNLWIGLFKGDISAKVHLSQAVAMAIPKENDGQLRTYVSFPVTNFRNEVLLGKKCLEFHIALVNGSNVVKRNCLRLQPKWMEEQFDAIKGKTILDLMLPGTHNSGSYTEGYHHVNPFQWLVDKYTLCQDENVFNQLAFGIRYLDLRVMYTAGEFWMAHDTYTMYFKLDKVLEDVKKFLEMTEKEIIILDFHRFPKGFDEKEVERHNKLLDLLETYLEQYLSVGYYSTIEQLVKNNERVFIGYPKINGVNRYYLESSPKQLWANTDDKVKLHEFFETNIRQKLGIPKVAMAELTPKTMGVVFDTYNGLRKLADEVNPLVTKWFRDEWSSFANVIATDYFLGNNIVEVAIKRNRQIAVRNA